MTNLSHSGELETLILGTAQFGQLYGVANRAGQPSDSQVGEILACAHDLGLRMLDTAAVYGESESILGRAGVGDWSVVTKVPSTAVHAEQHIASVVRNSVLRSLDRLRIDRLHAVLAHDATDLTGQRGARFAEALEELRDEGYLHLTGISVYGPDELRGLSEYLVPEIVQAPANVFDHRFLKSDHAKALRRRGGELHARSAFLQGLLLMLSQERPAYFASWSELFESFDARVHISGLSAPAFCLGFLARRTEVARCVVGVERVDQLTEIAGAFRQGMQVQIDADDLETEDLRLIDPRQWKVEK